MLGLLIIIGCSNSPIGNVEKETGSEAFSEEVKEFRVEAFQFGFEPSTITVNKGDTVRIIANSRDVPHGFAIDEYGINLYLDGLRSKTIEFTADKTGTFIYYCNVPCGGEHSSMRGRFIVK
ncbi:hypothetical protein GOV14_06600 [Candidatus Pacearchaeota archaeon]|nr:hypothetical protein [Candidatus Pacearchaeota archaeon]